MLNKEARDNWRGKYFSLESKAAQKYEISFRNSAMTKKSYKITKISRFFWSFQQHFLTQGQDEFHYLQFYKILSTKL